jgi:hypothetical protein
MCVWVVNEARIQMGRIDRRGNVDNAMRKNSTFAVRRLDGEDGLAGELGEEITLTEAK